MFVTEAIRNFFFALAALVNMGTCSPGKVMKIVSLFLCANLGSEDEGNKYFVARYHPQDGLSINFDHLKGTYPGSFIKLGKEKNGKSSLAAGYFIIFVSYEGLEYKILYKGNKDEDGQFFKSFSIFEDDVEVFYAKLVFCDGKPLFEIWENTQDSYFASLSRSKNASQSRAGPASAGPSSAGSASAGSASAGSASAGPASARPALAGPARIPSLPKVGIVNWNPLDDDDDDSNVSWADIDAPKKPVQDAPASKTPVQEASAPETSVQDAPASKIAVQEASAPETSVQDDDDDDDEVRLSLIDELPIAGNLKMDLVDSSIKNSIFLRAKRFIKEQSEMEEYFRKLLSEEGSSSA
jgi:hypothetical protein